MLEKRLSRHSCVQPPENSNSRPQTGYWLITSLVHKSKVPAWAALMSWRVRRKSTRRSANLCRRRCAREPWPWVLTAGVPVASGRLQLRFHLVFGQRRKVQRIKPGHALGQALGGGGASLAGGQKLHEIHHLRQSVGRQLLQLLNQLRFDNSHLKNSRSSLVSRNDNEIS